MHIQKNGLKQEVNNSYNPKIDTSVFTKAINREKIFIQ